MRHASLTQLSLIIAGALLACSRIDPQPASQSSGKDLRNAGKLAEPSDPDPVHQLPVSVAPSGSGGAEREALTSPYPRGGWRLARVEDLYRVVLWMSHILIRHREVPEGLLSFELPQWTSAPPAPERSREAAFALARELAERASARPDRFADIARESSEDVATRDAGGSLGGYGAFRLSAWPKVLDAMAALQPGQVSRVVETEFGFHVFTRRPPPPEAQVSGARIIIAHDDAPWLKQHLGRGSVPERSRVDARNLAQLLYERARANPGEFSNLVEKYSEHWDSLRAGDFGEWSTRERTPYRQAVEMLSQLEVGDVAPPVDSLFGYQIIQRTADRPRATYSMRSISIPFDAALPDSHPQSRQGAWRTARSIADALQSKPARFGEFQTQYCCSEVETWVEGRGSAPIEQALARLVPGQIGRELAEEADRFVIVERLDPQLLPPTTMELELPTPKRADVEYLVTHSGWLTDLDIAQQAAARALELEQDRARQLTSLQDIGERLQGAKEPERVEIYRDLQQRVSQLLGPEAYNRYVELVEEHFREKLVGDSASF